MSFTDRFVIKDGKPPAKFYIHTAGEEIFGPNRLTGHQAYLKNIFEIWQEELEKYDFLIGALWGDIESNERVADIFGFSDITQWPGNPDVSSWVVREGILRQENPISCAETLKLIGEELNIQRDSQDLTNYMYADGPVTQYTQNGPTHFL